MSTRTKIWLIPTLLYTAFVYWYTDFGGPLSDTEIAAYRATMESNGSAPETIAFIEEFARQDSGKQFLMVNNIDYNETPPAVEGANPNATAEELMARYMEHMLPAMLRRASHPVLMGPVVYQSIDVVGIEGAEVWDTGALFRYRSRRDLMDIVTNPVFGGKHEFKTAALTKSVAYPIEPQLYLGDPRLLLGLILLALTALIDLLRLSRQNR